LNEVFKTGAVFDLVNNFSPELAKVIGGLEKFDKAIQGSQAELKKFGFGNLAERTGKQLDALVQTTGLAVDKMIAHFARVDKAVDGTMGAVGKLGAAMSGDLNAAAKAGADGVIGNLGSVDKALTGSMAEVARLAGALTGDLTTAAGTASTELVAGFGRADASIATAVASASALKTEIGLAAAAANGMRIPQLPGIGGGGSGRGGGGGHGPRHGLHMRAPDMHIPGGGHVGLSQGSSGMVPAIGALAAGEVVKSSIEHAFDFDHWVAILKANGMSPERIDSAKQAAWANAGANPNASATDSLKTIIELNKVTGNLEESMKLLPTFSVAESGMQSVKAEGLHSRFNAGTQVFNFAKALEEMNATQNPEDKTPEEREARVKLYSRELLRTMITSNGTFDGNAAFAMTNNSGGASQNWDMNMATIVAPLLGDIMKHSKLGNADYMALKSYAGGGITSKATAALVKYGLADAATDTYTDKTGIHLNANSHFAEGITENIWDWSTKKLEALRAHGIDTNDQKQMNEIINEIGSNKSTTMLMRAVLEPGTRNQMQKEINQRGLVPEDAAGILTKNDPVLKLDAIHKKWDDFLTALGGPMTDTAITALTKIAHGLNTMAQAMEAHPEATKNIGVALAGVAVGLGALAVVSFTAFVPGGAVVLGLTTLASALTALAAVNWDQVEAAGKRLKSFVASFADTMATTAEKLGKLPGVGAPFRDTSKPTFDPNAIPPSGFLPMAFQTGGTANDNSPMVDMLAQGVFKGLQMYANGGGAAGGMGGGGGGIINASYGGGGGFGGGDSPLLRGARGGGGFGSIDRAAGEGSPISGSMGTRGEAAMSHLMSVGVSREAAAAIVGNAQQESSISPNGRPGDHGTAHGMFQWRFERFDALKRFAGSHGKSWTDANTQLDFMVDEAKHRGNAGWLTGHDVGAANEGMRRFERYGDNSYGTRLGNAHMWMGRGAAPTVAAPRPRVTPGGPAAGGGQAMNVTLHNHTHLDGKVIAKSTTKHSVNMIAQAMAHPTTTGSVNPRVHYSHGGVPLTDAA
jgi:hypothetical protein